MEGTMSKRSEALTTISLAEQMNAALPDLTNRQASDVVNDIVDILQETLVAGREIKISGFGKFYLKDKNARKGRNPQTGAEIEISARRVLGFKASDSLRQSLTEGTQ